MHSLAFNHFRRFENFPKIEFSDITFLVGKNNSGKSTFVNTVLLVIKYLQSGNLKKFNFNHQGLETLNVVTYGRVHCKNMTNPKDKDYIDFKLKMNSFEFYIKVSGLSEQSVADVHELTIVDHEGLLSVSIFPQRNLVEFIQNPQFVFQVPDVELQSWQKERDILETKLSRISDKFSPEFIEINSDISKIKKLIDKKRSQLKPNNISFTVTTALSGIQLESALSGANLMIMDYYEAVSSKQESASINMNPRQRLAHKFYERSDVFTKDVESLSAFFDNQKYVLSFIGRVRSFISKSRISYMPSNLTKQSVLFAIKNVHNPLSAALLAFDKSGAAWDASTKKFVNRWLKDLGIGQGYILKLIEGEAYTVKIKEGSSNLDLADKGMGSIQAFQLIIRLATIIYLNRQRKISEEVKNDPEFQLVYTRIDSTKTVIVILEEPELNLHPALQSKLADLIFEVHDKYKVKFIIETHSEYLIRKTQLFVKEKELQIAPNENPFSVIYFDEDKIAWSMQYREDGKFKNEFGTGFFDESTNLAFELL